MSNPNPQDLPAMMHELRILKRELEAMIAAALHGFETTTGLEIVEVELVRCLADNAQKTRVAAVHMTMKL